MSNVDITRIASNIGALNSLNALQSINNKLAIHQTRLSTGKRINSAADDPAGLTIATKMLARSEGLKVTLDNISDAKNMLSVAEGGMSKVTDIIIQMRNKAEQAASDTLGSSERATIQTQLSSYAQQIQDIIDQTKWNGVKLLDNTTGNKVFQTGVDEGESTTWTLPNQLDPAGLSLSTEVAASQVTTTSSGTDFVDQGTNEQIVKSGTLGSMSELSTGDYSFNVLDNAASSTLGKTNLNSSSTLITGVNDLSAVDVSVGGAELTSGQYTIKITANDTTNDEVSYTITNLTDSSWGTNGSMSVSAADITSGDLVDGSGKKIGVNLGLVATGDTDGLVVGQSMSFEYIAAGKAKIELNDATDQALQISQNSTGTLSGTYAYATANGTTAYNSGRGATIKLAAIATLTSGQGVAGFTYEQANLYSVNISTAAKAGQYMTTANYALDKVNSAMSDLGSLMARLTFKEESVTTAQVNVEAAYSRIMNANMAEEQMNASKYAILQQTGVAMLAQANQAPQNLLSLFR